MEFKTTEVPVFGDQFHYNKEHQLHSENDVPTVRYGIGSLRWYKNGLLHRDNGPATIDYDGSCCWFQNGLLHRDNEPAVIFYFGTELYYRNGRPV